MAEVTRMQYNEYNLALSGKFLCSFIPTFLQQRQLTVFIIVAEVENTWFFLSGSIIQKAIYSQNEGRVLKLQMKIKAWTIM